MKDLYKYHEIKKYILDNIEGIEEVNISKLHKCFISAVKQGYLKQILDEVILQNEKDLQ